MIEKIIKAVKRGNKRRGRNITIGAVIGFLLSCTAVMGADDNYLWIREDDGTIKFNTAITIDENGTKGNWKEENPYEDAGNIWDTGTKTYTNNTTLLSSDVNGKDGNYDISYGLRLSGNLTGVNFVNNASIMSTTSDSSIGIGIYNTGAIGNIANAGEISGTGSSSSSPSESYGIINNSGIMGTITNIGIISGTRKSDGSGDGTGSGIANNSGIMGKVENAGTISGIGSSSSGKGIGYGIFNISNIKKMGNVTNKMGTITNAGIISGTGSSSSGTGEGYGINNSSLATMGNITNTGLISGIGSSSSGNGEGYGICNLSTMENIENTGLISGYGNSTGGNGEGYGIYNKGTIEDIANTGLISGSGSGFGSGKVGAGCGIYNDSNGKEMGAITNTGIINGYGTNSDSGDGTGCGIYNTSGTMGAITNTGVINGYGYSTNTGVGGGIFTDSNAAKIGNITNIGIISGTGIGASATLGFGINNGAGTIGNITNTGIISGTGSGIYNQSGTIGAITNTGVIYGKTNAINKNSGTIDPSSNYGILVNGNGNNNKVIDGLDIVDKLTIVNGIPEKNQILNKGLIFTALDTGKYKVEDEDEYKKFGQTYVDENIVIDYQEDGTGLKKTITKKYTIINAVASGNGKNDITGTESLKLENGTLTYSDSDGEEQTETISSSKGYILNGITDTLKVSEGNNELNGSVINAYGTAVVFGDTGDNNQLTLSGTIVNGGIDEVDSNPGTKVATILGSSNGDNLILQSGKIKYTINGVEKYATQNTVVNGNIDMGGGDDTLTIGDGTIVNGTLDGGTGEDTLNFGISSGAKSNSSEREGVRILHNISNFENMNINTNVTLFEKTIGTDGKETNLEVTDVSKITIGKDGNLILRIDGTNKNSHALLGNTGGAIESDGGKLLLALNGVGEGSEIDIKMKLEDSMYGVENKDIEYSDKFTLDTTSLLHSVKRKNDSDSEVIVTSKSELPLSPDTPEDVNYEKLNKIYQSMRVVDGVKEFNVDTNEKLSIFLGYLNDIYAGNPYSYSSELSRKSVGMFRDIAVESQFKPELNKWLIMGGLTHVDGGTKDTYYGKGYYTYDIGSSDMDANTKITGAYMLGEYGVSDTLAYGVVIGGNKLKSDLSNGSKVDGDALYMGAYAKKYIGNLKVTGGLGLQYGDYDADRIAINKVASSLAEPVMKYSDNYNDMTYDIYLNGRYSHNIGENLFLEPYGTLSYTYVDQEGADEGSKVLAIETDSKSFDYTAAKVGVDLKKVIAHEKGKSTLSAGVSYTRLLTGADEENITGRFKGENATDFDILVAHKNEHSIGLNAKYTLELENGILFDVKGSYSVERDSHNESGKNRTKGEWIIGAGLGYKF